MARKQKESRQETIHIDNDFFEGVTARIETNIPMGVISKVDAKEPSTVVDFIMTAVLDWTGMDDDDGDDMKFSREGVETLKVAEMASFTDAIMEGIQNPPSRTKKDSPAS